MTYPFYDGMRNVNEVLNQLYVAFAAGPYNALPLTGGVLSGAVVSSAAFSAPSFITNGGGPTAHSALLSPSKDGQIGYDYEMVRLGVSGITGKAYPGYFSLMTSSGNSIETKIGYGMKFRAWDIGSNTWTADLLAIHGNGRVYVPLLKAGSSDPSLGYHQISRGAAQGDVILYVGTDGAPPSVAFRAGSGGNIFSQPVSVLHVGLNDVTGRGFSTPGTVVTAGNDYAEYIRKHFLCSIVVPGQIVGITADNTITDQWADAVMFSIKSTAPSFVGGDSWSNCIGQRPTPQAGPAPEQPGRRVDVTEQRPLPGTTPSEYTDVLVPGDTDAEWVAKQVAYAAAMAAHSAVAQQDAEAMAEFDAALEVERQKVDRIAIAGRVPVNVLDAHPGEYIVPAQDGEGIKGIAVHEDDLSMPQYLRAVGRVIAIEPDGRAYVMVKAV